MNEKRLRDVLSIFLALAHVGVPALLVALYFADGITKAELTDSLTIVLPMTTAISGMAITHIIAMRRRRRGKKGPKLSNVYVAFAFGLPIAFVALIAAATICKAYHIGISSFGDYKLALATIEMVFGAYTGAVMASLFGKENGGEG